MTCHSMPCPSGQPLAGLMATQVLSADRMNVQFHSKDPLDPLETRLWASLRFHPGFKCVNFKEENCELTLRSSTLYVALVYAHDGQPTPVG
jgi:hypothetical protein